jgi:hypothetical protein
MCLNNLVKNSAGMCEFIAGYEESKLLKRRMSKLAEVEKVEPKPEKSEEQLIMA